MKNIKEEFHNAFKDSSLFECWDNCEEEIVKWWIKKISLQKQEIVKEILQIAENSVYNMASKNAIINYAKERNIQLNKNYLTNYEK